MNYAKPQLARRGFLAASLATGAGALLAACAGPGSAGQPAATAKGVAGNVNHYHWGNFDRPFIEQIAGSFAQQYSGASVTQTIDPSEQYQATAAQKARDGAIGDVLGAFRGAQFQQFVDLGIFTSLDGAAAVSKYTPHLIEPGSSGGSQFGVPYTLLFNVPLLNGALAERAGLSEVPANWTAYLEALEAFRRLGVDPIAWPGNDPANAFQIINSLAMNHLPADDAFAGIERGERRATDDWWLAALTQFQELSGYFQKNFAGSSGDGATALFTQGQAAILPTGSYQIGPVRKAGASFPIELAPLITTPSGVTPKYEGIHNVTLILGVNAASKNPDAAAAWLEFLSQPENAAVYANGTKQHVTVAGVEYEDPDLAALSAWTSKKTLLAPRFQFNDLDIRSAVENSLVAVATGASPEQAAETAQKLIDEKLKA